MKTNINDNDFSEGNYINTDDDTCDLNPSKICDSCGECLELDKNDFKVVRIDGIATDGIEIEDYLLEDKTLNENENDFFDVQYIEDIPELKEEYDKKIDKLLGRE